MDQSLIVTQLNQFLVSVKVAVVMDKTQHLIDLDQAKSFDFVVSNL